MNAKMACFCISYQIPVFKGSADPLLGPELPLKDHFGTDGLGGVLENSEDWKHQIQKEHAVHAFIRLINENPGEVENEWFYNPVYL